MEQRRRPHSRTMTLCVYISHLTVDIIPVHTVTVAKCGWSMCVVLFIQLYFPHTSACLCVRFPQCKCSFATRDTSVQRSSRIHLSSLEKTVSLDCLYKTLFLLNTQTNSAHVPERCMDYCKKLRSLQTVLVRAKI